MTAAEQAEDAWDRYRVAWHFLATAVPVLTAAVIWSDSGLPTVRRVLASALLLLILAWYWWQGAPALRRTDDRAGSLHLAGEMLLFAGVLAVSMAAMFQLAVLTMQIFITLRRWRDRLVALGAIATVCVAGTVWHNGLTSDTAVTLAALLFAPLLIGTLFGAYISAVITQSRARSVLIAELTETRVQLARERHDAGVAAERERLSTEIHDTVAQGFTSILMLTQSARMTLDRPDVLREKLDLIERTARENLAEARSLVAALWPPDLHAGTVAEALERMAQRHTRDTGVPVSVEVTDPATPPRPEHGPVLLRAVQEALMNVRRHANAATVRIVLTPHTMRVIDDGRGFDPEQDHAGYGLPGLRSRVSGFGGSCTIESAPGAGTTVRVVLPA
ncbi:sensor histidine kinase [Dactylosporangium sp. CA-092794]|uniref:sensor histidine kinase n=1 Tax=Dactylosporangium sp. CA-092794 TaxID=3239929 RepID=UPI003D8E3D07